LQVFFFFNDTATTEIYTLSLHDALPIWDFKSFWMMMLYCWCMLWLPLKQGTTPLLWLHMSASL